MEKARTPHSSTLAWKIPWMKEPGRLQFMGSPRVGHDWATSLSLFTFHFHALEKEMATHSSVLAWRIPGTGEPGGLPSMGSHRVGHDWSDLAAAAETAYYQILVFINFSNLGKSFMSLIFLIYKVKVLDQTNNSQLMLGNPISIFRDRVEHIRILIYLWFEKTQYHCIILKL